MVRWFDWQIQSAILGAVLLLGVAAAPAGAAYQLQQDEVKAYLTKAFETYKTMGLDAAAADFQAPGKWREGPEHFNLHVGLTMNDQTVVADSGFPELVGLSYIDVADLDGNSLGKGIQEAIAKSPGGVALAFRFADPTTKAVAHAEGYCVQADPEHILCAWSEAV